MTEPTEGQKLAGEGVYVTLGGTPTRILVDNRAVVALEARWGSIRALGAELQKGIDGKMFTVVSDVLTATAQGLPPGLEALDLMDLARTGEYAEAILAAFQQAGLWSTDPGNGAGPKTGRSRGRTSTTRPSSRSGSTRPGSGA